MAGFLDKNAPSPESEYSRYLDGDILGKILAKSFLINRAGYKADSIYIPVGRYGDAETKYFTPGQAVFDPGDGYVDTQNGVVTFEIKCARINIANRYIGRINENWAFTNILKTPGKTNKKYDLLIAIGVGQLGLENARYWEHLQNSKNKLQESGRSFSLETQAHQADFLNICSFFIVPFKEINTNYFRVALSTIAKSKYSQRLAPGSDSERSMAVWKSALGALENLT